LTKYVLDKYEYIPNPLCPACKFSHLKERKTILPKYRCPKCHQEFDDSVKKTVKELIALFYKEEDAVEVRDKCFISKEWRTKNNLSNIRYWLLRERAKNKEGETIGKEAFLLYLNDSIHYLSFEDTITACRKCAYHYDIKSMELCPACKVYYKGIQYPTCIQCLPEEKRKAALEMIEFAKELGEMHKDLGID
jgi:hypothetical protein